MKTPLIIFGADDFARVVALEAEKTGLWNILAFVSDNSADASTFVLGKPILHIAEALGEAGAARAFVAGTPKYLNQDRLGLVAKLKLSGFQLATIVSPTASVAVTAKIQENVYLGPGVRILDRAIIHYNTMIDGSSVIGTDARLDSSCWIGPYCHIGTGSHVMKNVTLGPNVSIAPGVKIPAWSLVQNPRLISASFDQATFLDDFFPAPVRLYGR